MLGTKARGFVVAVLALTAAGALGCSSTSVDTTPSQANPLDPEEESLFVAITTFRQDNGVAPLTACASLNVAAAAQADDMRIRDYLDNITPEGEDTRARDCAAGYTPGCTQTASIAELVASGNDQGLSTAEQWESGDTAAILLDPKYVVAGVGRSIGETKTSWAMDLGSMDDPSCAGAE